MDGGEGPTRRLTTWVGRAALIAVGIGLLVLAVVAVTHHWSAEAWAALAAWTTAAVAIAAGLIALRQLGETCRVCLGQAQPYVAVFLDWSPAGVGIFDLVVRNFGTTAAGDVVVTITPTPQRLGGGQKPQEVVLPQAIPTLVPGQEWRTLWDSIFARNEAETDLPDRHEAVVVFKDSHGHPFK